MIGNVTDYLLLLASAGENYHLTNDLDLGYWDWTDLPPALRYKSKMSHNNNHRLVLVSSWRKS